MPRLLPLVAAVLGVIAPAACALAQPPAIHYVYDALHRLVAVVDQQGQAATYTYDAVGNILRIERIDPPPGSVAISLFAPSAGAVGATVQIFGKGFSATAAQNTVAFNGAAAPVTAAAANRLVVTVPPGATTGAISVTTPAGSATSATVFRVVGAMAIAPAGLTIPLGATRAFTATEGGAPVTTARWLVNGVPGGESSTGTISSAGLYTAPPALPFPAVVTVTAMHGDDSTVTASSLVTIVPPQPLFVASRAVTVAVRAPALSIHDSVTASVTVTVGGAGSAFGTAPPVSVRLAALSDTYAVGRAVSVSLAPVVTAVAPLGAPPGSDGLDVTITGAGLTDVTDIAFYRDGASDPQVTATHFVVNAEGTEAIVEVAVAPDAVPGLRVVRVTTPVGVSTAEGTGGNLFSIP
ncbi:MAG: IPT/TIG domain-containing protein [Candidatus Rokuibacteriota bacterium]